MAPADQWEELNELPGKALHGFAEQRLCFTSRPGLWFSPSPPIPYPTSPPGNSSGQGADSCLVRDTERVGSVLWQEESLGSTAPHDVSQELVPVPVHAPVHRLLVCTGDPHTACRSMIDPPPECGVPVLINFSHGGEGDC